MGALIWGLLGALLIVEMVGAVSKAPTISEQVDRWLRGKPAWVRIALFAVWIGLGIHLLFGWLQ